MSPNLLSSCFTSAYSPDYSCLFVCVSCKWMKWRNIDKPRAGWAFTCLVWSFLTCRCNLGICVCSFPILPHFLTYMYASHVEHHCPCMCWMSYASWSWKRMQGIRSYAFRDWIGNKRPSEIFYSWTGFQPNHNILPEKLGSSCSDVQAVDGVSHHQVWLHCAISLGNKGYNINTIITVRATMWWNQLGNVEANDSTYRFSFMWWYWRTSMLPWCDCFRLVVYVGLKWKVNICHSDLQDMTY